MLTEDYLMRLLRLATAAIAEALGLRVAKLYTDAIYVLDQMLEQVFGLRIDLINNLDENSLMTALWKQDAPDLDRMQIAADLIKEEADIFNEQGIGEESQWRYIRALNLYINVILYEESEGQPKPVEPINMILQRVKAETVPLDTRLLLFYYYDKIGNALEAERQLKIILQSPEITSDFSDEAASFYNRLLLKTDKELALSGLTRNDLEQKAAKFSQ